MIQFGKDDLTGTLRPQIPVEPQQTLMDRAEAVNKPLRKTFGLLAMIMAPYLHDPSLLPEVMNKIVTALLEAEKTLPPKPHKIYPPPGPGDTHGSAGTSGGPT